MNGIALNTPQNRAYLESLTAVTSIVVLPDADRITFTYEPALVDPAQPTPPGVYLHLEEAPF